jgi:hypothetical protein
VLVLPVSKEYAKQFLVLIATEQTCVFSHNSPPVMFEASWIIASFMAYMAFPRFL